MSYETIEYEQQGHIVEIRMARPERHNAVNDLMSEELIDAFRVFDDDDEAWVAILSGKGKSFSSGADVQQRQAQSTESLRRRGGPGVDISTTAGDTLGLGATINWKPVIAAVQGYALGGGFELAMQCDLVIATPETQFEITQVSRGIGGAYVWAAAWFWGGGRMASELAIAGGRLSGEEAFKRGMVNRLVSREALQSESWALAEQIVALPPLAVRANVRVCRYFVREMVRESQLYPSGLKLYLTEDYQEAVRARIENRTPAPYKAR